MIWIMSVKGKIMILVRVVGDLDHVGKGEEMNLARVVGDLDHVGKGGDEPCQAGR